MSDQVKTKRTKTKKSSSSKKLSKSELPAAAAVAPAPEEVQDVAEDVPVEADTTIPSTKRIVTKETIDAMFEQFLVRISEQMELTRESKDRNVTVRFWQSLERDAKKLRTDVRRVTKLKRRCERNLNGGFDKKFQVTKEIAKFVGWDPTEMHSRNDVSNAIISYVKENKLQNPADGREIFPDKKLTKILGFDESEMGTLTFYKIQKLIGKHFIK